MVELNKKPFNLNEEDCKWVEDTLASMSDMDKVEQLFCPIAFMDSPEALTAFVGRHKFGGVMFRPGHGDGIKKGIAAMQKASPIPMFVTANLEDGGNGISADSGTYMGRQMLIAATGDPHKAWQLGKICAREGKAIGVNWTFAPVSDIDMNFRNPITNVRTYGDNAESVLSYTSEYIKACMEEDMLVSAKHFPGDGVDERDQHLLTTVNSLSIDEWENSYGKIYRGLIEQGVMTVMVGHIAMPAMEELFDEKPCKKVLPATLSKNILTGYLRGKLGFNGLVSTDASPMAGFMTAMERRKAVPLSIEYGCDMFLFTKDLEEDIQFMYDGYKEGLLSQERLDDAVRRILATKAAVGLHKVADWDVTPGYPEVMQCEEHLRWAKECADMGVTLVKDTANLLPLSVEKHKHVLVELIGDFPSNERVYKEFTELLEKEGFEVEAYVPETIETIFADASVTDFRKKYDLVLYIGNIENASNKTVSRIQWHTLFGAGNNIPWFAPEVPSLFVSVGNPYHLLDVPMIPTYINGYCHSPYVIEAVVEKLMGRSEFKGISPVDPFCNTFGTDF